MVEVAGVEPACSSFSMRLLRAQPTKGLGARLAVGLGRAPSWLEFPRPTRQRRLPGKPYEMTPDTGP